MEQLPRFEDFSLRLSATLAFSRIQPHLLPEDSRDGIYWGFYALVDESYDCPANLLEMDHGFAYGRRDLFKKRACMWQREKAMRLAYYVEYENMDALSAFQAHRNRKQGRKGGAILLDVRIPETGKKVWRVILSAAGINEHADEAFLLFLARIAPWELTSVLRLDSIAEISHNPYYEQARAV